jgi:hypothetical protein
MTRQTMHFSDSRSMDFINMLAEETYFAILNVANNSRMINTDQPSLTRENLSGVEMYTTNLTSLNLVKTNAANISRDIERTLTGSHGCKRDRWRVCSTASISIDKVHIF